MHSRRRILWAVAGAGGAALAVLALLPWAPDGVRERADQIGSVLGGLSAVIGLPVAVLAVWALTGRPSSVTAADPVERLAELVGRQWNREAVRRGLRGSAPMRIRWRVTERAVGVPADEVVDLGGARVRRVRAEGDVLELAERWRRLPYRRLAVLGRPGAGKTSAAVLFTCGLLDGRAPGEPVPVLLDLSGWRPSEEGFEAWLGRTLAGLYGLRAIARQTGRLIEHGRIVAVLDGFDEMPAGQREAALAGLNEFVDLPLVLLSRADEYEATVSAGGEPLAHALIVELDPLTAQQTARYLPGGQADSTGRWAPVERHLTAEPDGSLARSLSNPLLAYLARTVHRRPGSAPAAMMALAATGELERHLFDGYLPALYPDRGGERYPPARAATWLGFLARSLDRQSPADLAWWRIGWSGTRRVPAARLAASVALSWPLVLLGAGFGGSRFVLFEGLAVAAAVAAYFTDVDEPPVEPRQVRFQPRTFLKTVLAGPALLVPVVLPSLRPVLGAVVVTVLAVALTLLAAWASRTGVRHLARAVVLLVRAGKRRRDVEIPDLTQNTPAVAYLVGQAAVLLSGGLPDLTLAGAVGVVLLYGLPIGVLTGVGVAFARPAPRDDLWDPGRSLRDDRFALLAPPLLVAATSLALALLASAVGLWPSDWSPAPGTGLAFGLIAAAIVWAAVIQVVGSAWFTYAVVRLWLALRGRLPWRLMPFLADAARRGVLRRNGAVYQFRHERLREHLAGGITAEVTEP